MRAPHPAARRMAAMTSESAREATAQGRGIGATILRRARARLAHGPASVSTQKKIEGSHVNPLGQGTDTQPGTGRQMEHGIGPGSSVRAPQPAAWRIAATTAQRRELRGVSGERIGARIVRGARAR